MVGGYRDDVTPEQAAWMDALVETRLASAYGYGGGEEPVKKPTAELAPRPS